MRAVLTALICAAAGAHAQQGGAPLPVVEELRPLTPDELAGSTWRRMTGLALRRFRERADALPMGSQRAHDMYRECIDDAWFLGEVAFVQGERAPCGQVISGGRSPDREQLLKRAGAESRSATPLSLVEFRRCAERAWDDGTTARLDQRCATDLARRAEKLPELDDDRLASWLGACKALLTGGASNSAFAPAAERDPFERHCMRTLQILYDATGKQRLSDWWTREELQKLQKRKAKK